MNNQNLPAPECPHCGGELKERSEADYENDEIYLITYCQDCGYEEH